MATNSKIEWTEHTANLWHGCTKVHEGCDHCYAETLSHRWGRDIWGNDKPRLEIKSVWKDLAKFQKLAAAAGEVHRVFVGSMMDIFEKPMPLIGATPPVFNTSVLRRKLFVQIDDGLYPNLLFLFLTKRPSNINKYIPESWKTNPPGNVMFGTSPVNQATANTLIPQLLQVKGKKFLSIEPMLGPIMLSQSWIDRDRFFDLTGGTIDWVICGGESGHGARPMHPDWARSLRDQCKAAGVPFFFKQWGEHQPGSSPGKPGITVLTNGWNDQYGANPPKIKDWNADDWHALHPTVMSKVGKKAAGRLLDGVEYNEFPNQTNVK